MTEILKTPHSVPLKLLWMSTPVGPLGSGLGGGVELTLTNLNQVLSQRGHQIQIVAPAGSVLPNISVIEIPGDPPPTAHTQTRDTPALISAGAVLPGMWNYARSHQHRFDLIVNFAYDWLPFYLTPFFQVPVAHFVSMGSLSKVMDWAIAQVVELFPSRIGFYTETQARTFKSSINHLSTEALSSGQILGSAIDLALYHYCSEPANCLAWLGRVSPEKGLEDAIAAAQATGIPLKIMGKLEDEAYWQQLQMDYPHAPVQYLGFLPTVDMQAELRCCRALLMTPRWVEAFGNVAIEALACGVPVIAYSRGGPREIVDPGRTGYLVSPDSVDGLIEAIAAIDQIDRRACREQAEVRYSLEALGDRFEAWFDQILSSMSPLDCG